MSADDTKLVERLRERIADADTDITDALTDAETTGEPVDPDDWHVEVPVNWLRKAVDRICALKASEAKNAALTAENATLREALLWYAEKVVDLRKNTSEAEAARQSLDTDVGQRARAALRQETGRNG